MRYSIALFVILLSITVTTRTFAQVTIINENFSDGDFTNNPTWIDSASKHIINSSNVLQLHAPASTDEAIITTSSTAAYGSWETLIQLDFNPSSSNLARFYLISDTKNIKESLNGYFIEVGSLDDDISLYRQDGSETTKIIDGPDNIVDNDPVVVRIKATRDLNGNWELFADTTGNKAFKSLGAATDNTHLNSNSIGFLSDYTSTRSERFLYDDITVVKITPPLSIQTAKVIDKQNIDITFNLDIDTATASRSSFSIDNGAGNPNSISFPSSNTIRLNYNAPLPSNQYTVTINNIEDTGGNEIDPNTTIPFTLYGTFTAGDIKINEFMSDPPTGQSEYIELINTSNKYINLSNWQIGDNGGTDLLKAQNIVLQPDSFLVISADTTALYNTYGTRNYYQFNTLASLNNGSDAIQLATNSGILVDSLSYTSDWGGNDVALERRSATTQGVYIENWGSSPNPHGGTPGQTNEIAPDITPPSLTAITIQSAKTILLGFSERLMDVGTFSLSGDINIQKTKQTAPDSLQLSLATNLQNAQSYTLSGTNSTDIFGNILNTDTIFTFYNPSPADSGDVAINEFMAAPSSSGSEYIEIYNHSNKSLDLQGWILSDNRTNGASKITESQFIVPPDSFAVIAPDYSLSVVNPNINLLVMPNMPSLNNGGDQIILRNKRQTILDSLAYSSDWGEDEVSLERRSVDVSGIFRSNWATAPNGYGTPGRSNKANTDKRPPVISSFDILSNTELSLHFTKQMDSSSLQNSENYRIQNGPNIISSVATTTNSTHLKLDDTLKNGKNYNLSVENVEDIFGNLITKTDTTFVYYELSPVDSGDVVINEFSYDPADGSTEFIEIYNPTAKSYNLQNWTLSDNRHNPLPITNSKFILPPDSFVVIAPDNTLLRYFPHIALVAMPNFPSLNNSGDDIVIRNGNSTLLDSLRYHSHWGGSEGSLERRTTSVSGVYSENWNVAPGILGTPGKINQAPKDNTAPTFEKLHAVDNRTLLLIFSERITATSATNIQNYQISPVRNVQLISARNDSVLLHVSAPLTSGEHYDVTVSSLSDIFNNSIGNSSLRVEYLKLEEAVPSDIVINEILYNPGSSGKADFIELYNTTEKNFDLSNWVIGDASQTTSINKKLQLRGKEYLVLTGNNLFAQSRENIIALDNFPALNNRIADKIYLRNQNGETIDSLQYDQSWGGNKVGTSLERKDPLAASNDRTNWETNDSSNGTSAGIQNSIYQEDTQPPAVIFSGKASNEIFEIRFSEFIQLTDQLIFQTDNQELQIVSFDSTKGDIIYLIHPNSLQKESVPSNASITVKNLSDIRGNVTANTEIAVAQPLEPGDLVMNEIMFNPLNDPNDNRPDQGEYIELKNIRDYAISLEGLLLHDAPDEDGNVRMLEPITTEAKWVPAQGKVLIHADETPEFMDSKIATFFDLNMPKQRSIMRIARSSLSLASTNDAIYLSNISETDQTTIDSVYYDESWHNPNLIDTRGIALERVAPTGPSDEKSNWGSSINPKGGTPGTENSIYQQNSSPPEKIGISFSPNPFSPDNDGFEDKLFINYRLEQQDYLIDINIYDRYGRHIRELADGKQAGLQGQLMWDGRKDDSSRNRIGIYIVIFEAYDSSSGKNHSFKKTVVLARKLH